MNRHTFTFLLYVIILTTFPVETHYDITQNEESSVIDKRSLKIQPKIGL